MKLFSIDVGIKNLSFCLFEVSAGNEELTNKQIKILKWDNIDLSEKNETKCIEIDKNGLCDKPAKFIKESNCYCLKHSKIHNFLQPIVELNPTFLAKQKIQNLIDLADKYNIKYELPARKNCLIEKLIEFSTTNCYSAIDKTNATKVDLVTIGKNIQHKLDEILSDHLATFSTIIIENQIGPIANKMKTIQGMLAQYFIMKNNNIQIEFISASNKLKDFIKKNPEEKIDYKQRKKLGIKTCLEIINTDFRFKEWDSFVNKHKKKDDLSDCFLQGMWYIKYKII